MLSVMSRLAYEVVSPEEFDQERRGFVNSRPEDTGGDLLPFVPLGGRRFEILTFLLKKALAASNHQVTLVKSSRDRGRDVMMHSDGVLVELIQCKNQDDPMGAPDVLREVLKIALHSYLDPTMIPGTSLVTLSMWCPAGFSEPAATVIDRWPAAWAESQVSPRFEELKEKFASFKNLAWADVREHVLRFSTWVRLSKEDNISLTPRIRANSAIHRQFFSSFAVVPLDDTKALVHDFMQDKGWRQISSDDIRHIVDRVSAFSDHTRFYLGQAHVLGMSAEFIADIPDTHREKFLKSLVAPIFGTATIILGMVADKSIRLVQESIRRFTFENQAFPVLLHKCITSRGLSQCSKLFTPTLLIPTFEKTSGDNPALTSTDLWYVLDELCTRVHASFAKILAADFQPPTTDEAQERQRKALATHVLAGHADAAAFVASLKRDCRQNLPLIRELVTAMEDYLPKDLVIVADARAAFEDPLLLKSLVRSMQAIDDIRAPE